MKPSTSKLLFLVIVGVGVFVISILMNLPQIEYDTATHQQFASYAEFRSLQNEHEKTCTLVKKCGHTILLMKQVFDLVTEDQERQLDELLKCQAAVEKAQATADVATKQCKQRPCGW